MGQTMFVVCSSMFDLSKSKIGCLSLIINRLTSSSSFVVRKNDVPVCLMSLVNLMKALLGLMLDVHLITNRKIHVCVCVCV